MIDDVLVEFALQQISASLKAQLSALLRRSRRFRADSGAPSGEASSLAVDPAVLGELIQRMQEDLRQEARTLQLPDQQVIGNLISDLDDQTIVAVAKEIAGNPAADETVEEASQQLRRAGIRRMQPRTVLAIVLVWLAALGGPVAAVEAPATAQAIINSEVATIGTALAITWRALDRSRDSDSRPANDHDQAEVEDQSDDQ
jgi:hypothetical protein